MQKPTRGQTDQTITALVKRLRETAAARNALRSRLDEALDRLAEVEKERDIAENQAVEFGAHLRQVEKERDAARAALEMSEKRFATLKEAYDRERRRSIEIVGSALSDHQQPAGGQTEGEHDLPQGQTNAQP